MGYRGYGDLVIIYPKACSIYLRGTIGSLCRVWGHDSSRDPRVIGVILG